MEIAALKLRLIQLILEIDNQEVLLKVLEILDEFKQNQDTSDLSEEQITEIDRRLELLATGQTNLRKAEDVIEEIRTRKRLKKQQTQV